jgi:uncharacterized protein YndB with AHSA1/START domain
VWDAFTKPELFIQWWGPRGWQTEVKEFNCTEGGVNHYGMKCLDEAQGEWYGKYSWGKMVFLKINPIDSLDYQDFFVDENAIMQEGMPVITTHQEFIDENGMTKIISVGTYETEEALKTVIDMGMIQGVTETWDRLDELVTK